uniref:Transmembrane and coiled-coil domain-containing protein 1 n=1 Tax=Anas platyrhynchos TaxID=8839 RepID=A0A8B9SG16_ANAPL
MSPGCRMSPGICLRPASGGAMSTMFADTLLIVFISVCTALLAEGITWVLVYRTDKYKRLKKKETITESAGRQQKKKIGKVRRGVNTSESSWELVSSFLCNTR